MSMQRKHQKGKFLLVVGVMCLPVFFYPFEETVAPAYSVKVIDPDHQPLRHAKVIQRWQQYSIQNDDQSEKALTDELGNVQFAERSLKASLFSRTAGCLNNFRKTGVHTSCGSRFDIVVAEPNVMELNRFDEKSRAGNSLNLVVRQCPTGRNWPCERDPI